MARKKTRIRYRIRIPAYEMHSQGVQKRLILGKVSINKMNPKRYSKELYQSIGYTSAKAAVCSNFEDALMLCELYRPESDNSTICHIALHQLIEYMIAS